MILLSEFDKIMSVYHKWAVLTIQIINNSEKTCKSIPNRVHVFHCQILTRGVVRGAWPARPPPRIRQCPFCPEGNFFISLLLFLLSEYITYYRFLLLICSITAIELWLLNLDKKFLTTLAARFKENRMTR